MGASPLFFNLPDILFLIFSTKASGLI